MCREYSAPILLGLFLLGSPLAYAVGRAQVPSAGVVRSVLNVDVVQDSPIAVELDLGQDEVVAGENFVLSVRLTNLTGKSIVLRGFDMEDALSYIWASIDGAPFQQGTRVHPDSISLPSEGESTTVLGANEPIEHRMFVSHHDVVYPEMRDVLSLSLIVCPVFVLVNGKQESAIAVESNVLNVKLRRPTQREGKALRYLIDLEQLRGEQSIPYRERYRLFLEHYPDVPYAARVRFNLVRAAQLDKYKTGTPELPSTIVESIDFCLDRGSPFADAVLTNACCEFFAMTGRWHLLERAAKLLAETPEYDRRFHNTHAYVGGAVVELDSTKSPCDDPVWRRRLQPVLLKCLKRALTRGDEDAQRLAPRVLSYLEHREEWRLLERAAELALDDPRSHEKATRALELAQEGIKNN